MNRYDVKAVGEPGSGIDIVKNNTAGLWVLYEDAQDEIEQLKEELKNANSSNV